MPHRARHFVEHVLLSKVHYELVIITGYLWSRLCVCGRPVSLRTISMMLATLPDGVHVHTCMPLSSVTSAPFC